MTMPSTDEKDPATERALAALDAMAEQWAETIGLIDAMILIAGEPNRLKRGAKFMAFAKQAFVEGAYRCYLDAKDGKIPWMKVIR